MSTRNAGFYQYEAQPISYWSQTHATPHRFPQVSLCQPRGRAVVIYPEWIRFGRVEAWGSVAATKNGETRRNRDWEMRREMPNGFDGLDENRALGKPCRLQYIEYMPHLLQNLFKKQEVDGL